MIKGKISCLQLSSMVIMGLLSSFTGVGFYSIVRSAGIDAYMSPLIAGIFGLLPLLGFLFFVSYEPDLPLPLKINKLFGKYFGFVLNAFIILVVVATGISTMFNLTNFIVSQFLPETPTFVVGILFCFVIVYVNIKGLETLSRTCFILAFLSLILHVITVLGLLPTVEISNLKPFLEHGIGKPIVGSLYILSLNISPLLILSMIPKNQVADVKNYTKAVIIGYVIAIFFMSLISVVTLGSLGIHLAKIYQYPEYIVLKRINFFNFLDRIENIIIIQWIFDLFCFLSFIVFYVSNAIKVGNKSRLLPIGIVGVLLFSSQFFFRNNTVFNNYMYGESVFVRGSLYIVMLLIVVMAYIKKKKEKKSKILGNR